MRINRIAIKNFRIYKGLNEISFKQNRNDKNITIISGQNGFGKTTFLTALVWGFYGKLIGEVDNKYKQEVSEAGGYKKFAKSILNREVKSDKKAKKKFSVEIEISDIYIPSVPCSKVIIKRQFDFEKEQETTSILIDGFENELTKEVGSDIFINDFILPREIAKFFLFDSEKIVSLAEIKTLSEKRSLSKAYSEVLGISKYEKLKNSLENLRIKLRKKSANLADKQRLTKLQQEAEKIAEIIKHNQDKISENDIEIEKNKQISEQYQEKLIREGNSMSVEDVIKQKELRDVLKKKQTEIKSKLKELIELAPFAIAGNKLNELYKQIKKEADNKQNLTDNKFIENKLKKIKQTVEKQINENEIPDNIKNKLFGIMKDAFETNLKEQKHTLDKVLLDLTPEQSNEFEALYNNLRNSYSILFKQIVKEEKNNRIFLLKTMRKISNAETKDTDVLAQKYKTEKAKIDLRISELYTEQNKLHEEIGDYKQQLSTKTKIISELAKNVSLDKVDEEKDKVTERLINELTDFIYKFKAEKKKSLQTRLKQELLRLMHKEDFIENVNIELTEEIIDISLQDKNRIVIEKETLSKGEQQLFATALLKTLVDESGIQFPIFIDSPLQKFDKRHSNNIITEFYPTISKQVILFPLLEKELTEKEYKMLMPHISQTFKIESLGSKSTIKEYKKTELFTKKEELSNVYTYQNIKSE